MSEDLVRPDPADAPPLEAPEGGAVPGPVPDDAWVHGALARGMPWAVAQTLPHLPESPGVYLWKDADGRVLYVGKAKRLRARVRWYWSHDHEASPRTRGLLRKVAALETIVVPSEAHALVLEATLIKEHHPRFNVALRDDKTYPCIKVTVQEPFPRVVVTRRLEEDGARYFGPYTDVGAMRRALNVVKRLFTVRSCHYALPREAPERPCLDYHIQRCKAPCVGYQSAAEYGEMIDEVVWFLEGKTAEVVRRVQGRMVEAAERLDFERAAELRDVLRHLERMEEPTVVLEVEGGDRDVVGYARDGDDACVVVMRVRNGALLAREHRLLEHAEEAEDGAVLGACLAQWYRVTDPRASELLVPFDFADREALAEGRDGRWWTWPTRMRGTCWRSSSWPRWRQTSGRWTPCTSSSGNSGSPGCRGRWCAWTSRTRRGPTWWRARCGSRTGGRAAESIGSSRWPPPTPMTISRPWPRW
jgi:excinuclease ABC subunit C